ncbi:MAG: PAS domain S-box protein, partial [Sulfurimicrobium sp.]|nr:PAS domain S-box protein [Sulfurimicrobium sp.]
GFVWKSKIEATYARLVDRQHQLVESEKKYREAYDGLQREMEDRRKVQQALAESEGLYRMITDNVSDILWTTDLNYRFNYISPSIIKVRGFTVKEALSQRLEEMLTPESLQAVVQEMATEDERLKRHPEDWDVKITIELEQYRKDGSTVWTENEINYLFDQNRRPIGIIGVTREISKRKRIETALRESEEKFRSIAENSKEVIWMMDMNLRFTYINPYIEHNMGYTPEEYLQLPLDKLMTPASLSMCMHLLSEELENERRGDQDPNRFRMIEVDHIHKDGKTVHAELNMTFMRDASGRAVGILGLTRDISEGKRLEAERQDMEEHLQRAEKMEALGQLAGGVAHDLNNVLGVSTLYSELLQEKIPEESPLRKYVDNILSSTQKGAAIIEDLLTLARRGVTVSDLMNLNGIVSNFLKNPVFEKIQAYHPHVTFRT